MQIAKRFKYLIQSALLSEIKLLHIQHKFSVPTGLDFSKQIVHVDRERRHADRVQDNDLIKGFKLG